MKIYVGHATTFNYKDLLYEPLKNSKLWKQHDFILPHDLDLKPTNSKQLISTCDLFIAEVSYPSTGLGIELGWAEDNNVPILCLHKRGVKISSSLHMLFKDFIVYTNKDDMIRKIEQWVL